MTVTKQMVLDLCRRHGLVYGKLRNEFKKLGGRWDDAYIYNVLKVKLG